METIIVDTTLREGEQTPGAAFSIADKVAFVQLASSIGIREMEIGTPAMGGNEIQAIREIIDLKLPGRFLTWNRTVPADIETSLSLGLDSLFISTPVSDFQIQNVLRTNREQVLSRLIDSLTILKGSDVYIACGLQDASRSNDDFLKEVIAILEDFKVNRVRLSDTLGILTPEKTKSLVKRVQSWTSMELEVHTHNDFGMATANALAAAESGVQYIDGTILGVGERAGNAPVEELAVALHVLYNQPSRIHLHRLPELAHLVAKMIGMEIPRGKPVFGGNVFSHESGIHVAGVLRNPANYEPYPPELVGREREIRIGKHSGKNALLSRFQELGEDVQENEIPLILELVRKRAEERKRTLTDQELIELRHQAKDGVA